MRGQAAFAAGRCVEVPWLTARSKAAVSVWTASGARAMASPVTSNISPSMPPRARRRTKSVCRSALRAGPGAVSPRRAASLSPGCDWPGVSAR